MGGLGGDEGGVGAGRPMMGGLNELPLMCMDDFLKFNTENGGPQPLSAAAVPRGIVTQSTPYARRPAATVIDQSVSGLS
jgi:hypothetical protein